MARRVIMLLTGISDVRMSISILGLSLSSYLYQLLIKLVKCSLMTQEQHSNSYIYTPFLGDVLLKPLSYYCVSTHVSTAYQYTKGPSRVRLTYVSIRSSYSTIRSSYAEVLRFLCVHLNVTYSRISGVSLAYL